MLMLMPISLSAPMPMPNTDDNAQKGADAEGCPYSEDSRDAHAEIKKLMSKIRLC